MQKPEFLSYSCTSAPKLKLQIIEKLLCKQFQIIIWSSNSKNGLEQTCHSSTLRLCSENNYSAE